MSFFPNPLEAVSDTYNLENWWGFGSEFGLTFLVIGLITTAVITYVTGDIRHGATALWCTLFATVAGILLGPICVPIVLIVGLGVTALSIVGLFANHARVTAFVAKLVRKPLQFIARSGKRDRAKQVADIAKSELEELESAKAAARLEQAKVIAHPLLRRLADKLVVLNGGASIKQNRDDVAELLLECDNASKKLPWPPMQQQAVDVTRNGISFLWDLYETDDAERPIPDTTTGMESVLEALRSTLQRAIEDAAGFKQIVKTT